MWNNTDTRKKKQNIEHKIKKDAYRESVTVQCVLSLLGQKWIFNKVTTYLI